MRRRQNVSLIQGAAENLKLGNLPAEGILLVILTAAVDCRRAPLYVKPFVMPDTLPTMILLT